MFCNKIAMKHLHVIYVDGVDVLLRATFKLAKGEILKVGLTNILGMEFHGICSRWASSYEAVAWSFSVKMFVTSTNWFFKTWAQEVPNYNLFPPNLYMVYGHWVSLWTDYWCCQINTVDIKRMQLMWKLFNLIQLTSMVLWSILHRPLISRTLDDLQI